MEPSSLEAIWKARIGAKDSASKNVPGVAVAELVTLLDDLPEARLETEYRTLLTLPESSASEFQQALVQAFVALFARRKSDARLIPLLAARCPRYVGLRSIEFVLATAGLQNPVEVMVKAYGQAKSDPVRHTLFDALSSAFPSLRSRATSEEQFIKACLEWYSARRTASRSTWHTRTATSRARLGISIS
jgi:hypothetical protein